MDPDGRSRRQVRDRDRISSLPDDLLLAILVRLRSTPAAARTSLLSRRWRHVWTQLPEIVLDELAADSVDAALAANTAPTLSRLAISEPSPPAGAGRFLECARVAAWLRVASERLAGKLSVDLPEGAIRVEEELVLPPMERVTEIWFWAENILRPPPAGSSFPALRSVDTTDARMEARDMEECFGSSRCPRLQALSLRRVSLVTMSDVSIRSETLERLFFNGRNVSRLEVVAPRLELLRAPKILGSRDFLVPGRVVAPRLADVAWYGTYDPRHHQFVGAGRHLRKLLVVQMPMAALMQRFDTVDELSLRLAIPDGVRGYESFLEATHRLAKCDAIQVFLDTRKHAYAPSVLHVLRKSTGLRKLVVPLPPMTLGSKSYPCWSPCPCCCPESYKNDNFALDSLQEVVIMDFRGLPHHVEFLTLFLGCNAAVLRNVTINMSADAPVVSEEIFQKIRSFAPPNVHVAFSVSSRHTL
ncbi:hypothetical protein EJB05_52259, partial [Eragrostis curvula]